MTGMDQKEQKRLKELAKLMLAEAQSSNSDRVFSATGFARENISILHQQVRCANLAWALRHARRVRRGDVVAIVGGSFSGLMLACSLAIADDVIVYIFEKDKRLLNRFLDKSHRHLSPNLNSRYLGKRFDPRSSAPFYRPAIFPWEPGPANEVAHEWLKNFEAYYRKLPIFVLTETEVKPCQIEQCGTRIKIKWPTAPNWQPVEVDLLLDATGFGDEANTHHLPDYSYWEAGHRLIYDHLPEDCSVLISGCGDSGIIEALHYAIKDFRHEFVEGLWPSGENLEARLDLGLESAKLDEILLSSEIESYDGKIISELCWWLYTWRSISHLDARDWSPRGAEKSIFEAIGGALKPHLLEVFAAQKLDQPEWDELEAFLFELDMSKQLMIREKIMPLVDDWISTNIEALVREIPHEIAAKLQGLPNCRRTGVEVVLNGLTPSPYTRQMSSYNVWLTRILMGFPNVRYKRGKITNAKRESSGRYKVTYSDGETEDYDRVVTRYGPASSCDRRLSNKTHPDPHRGNWLLNHANYLEWTEKFTETAHRGRIVEPAKEDVSRRVKEVLQRRGSRRVQCVNKRLYAQRLLSGQFHFSANVEYLDSDPQTWLSSKLRAGVRPTYCDGDINT